MDECSAHAVVFSHCNNTHQPGCIVHCCVVIMCLLVLDRCVQTRGAAFLLGLPPLTCLVYDAYQRLQMAAVVLAVEKGDPQV